MGSTAPTATSDILPPSSSPDLLLTHPTPSERTAIWTQTHPLWGSALEEETYLKREAYLQTIPVAKAGGITNWILTTSPSGSANPERPVLSSCETLRKRALVSVTHADGRVELRDGLAHGIGSVFTAPEFRGHGYASRMMSEVGTALRSWKGGPVDGSSPPASPGASGSPANGTTAGHEVEGGGASGERRSSGHCLMNGCSGPGPSSLFSVLYSDIGKTFYARHGWTVFPSVHVSFSPSSSSSPSSSPSAQPTPLAVHDLAPLATLDEALLRVQLSQPAPAGAKHVRAALIPDLDTLLWHLLREDFMTSQLFSRVPGVRGCLVGPEGHRVWAVWTRNYYSPKAEDAKKNTMYVLRFVIEDEANTEMEELVAAFRAIMSMAQREAEEWKVGRVDMWNPGPLVTEVIKRSGIECEWEDREVDSIPSLMWYGEGSAQDVEWIANEKYAWC